MNLTAEQIQIASLIDTRVRELAAAGSDDVTTFAEMADYMPGFKRLMDMMGCALPPLFGVFPIRKDPGACGGGDSVG